MYYLLYYVVYTGTGKCAWLVILTRPTFMKTKEFSRLQLVISDYFRRGDVCGMQLNYNCNL